MRISALLPMLLLLAVRVAAQSGADAKADSSTDPRAGCSVHRFAGYRLHHFVVDAALNKSWAVLASCEHPSAPWKAVEVHGNELAPLTKSGQSATSAAAVIPQRVTPEIAAGSRVRLWKSSDTVQMNLQGVALENGIQGVQIRVRLAPNDGIASLGAVLRGVVRGPGSVELAGGSSGHPSDARSSK